MLEMFIEFLNRTGKLNVIKLLAKGGDLNAEFMGMTPLHHAAFKRSNF